MATHDFYTTLGVKHNATQSEIKQAYRRLAKKYHPDVSQEANAEAQFKKIVEAYDRLKSTEKRQHYDSLGSTGNAAFTGLDPELFGDLFKQTPTKNTSTRTSTNKPSSQTIPFAIELEDVFHGASKTLRLANGKKVTVTIPQGIEEGKKIRLAQMAENGADVLLAIQINPHKQFKRQGKDLYIEQTVSAIAAEKGTTLPIDTLVERLDVKIPAGTKSGAQIQLKAKGLPYKPAGLLIITIHVEKPIPTPKAATNTEKKNKFPPDVQQQVDQLVEELNNINEMLKQIEAEHSQPVNYRFHTLLHELHQETCLLAKESNNPTAMQTAIELHGLIEAMQITLSKLTPN